MPKKKKCSFCQKEVDKLWYSNPKCCMSYECRKEYSELKGKPKKTIPKFSDKKLEELAVYRPLRDKYLKEHPICEAQIQNVCQYQPVELHHKKTRQHHLCDTSIFMSACRKCHDWIEANDEEARKLGFKINHLTKE